jgi:hypothetical protein
LTGCVLCARPIDEATIAASLPAGRAVHPACLAERLPEDALVLAVAALALVLVAMAVVWAG